MNSSSRGVRLAESSQNADFFDQVEAAIMPVNPAPVHKTKEACKQQASSQKTNFQPDSLNLQAVGI